MTINPIIVQTGGGESWVELIDNPPFFGVAAIKTFSLPPDAAGATSIPGYAFYGCTSLASVTIPAGLTSIDYDAFYSCTSLMTMDVLCETPPTLASSGLADVPVTCSIRVPAGSVGAYKAAPNWSARAAYITALP